MSGYKMKYDARIALGEPIDESRNKARGQQGAASDPHFSGRGVGEKLDGLQRAAQVIEDSRPSIKQGATVFGRLDTLGVAIDQTHANGLFQFGD